MHNQQQFSSTKDVVKVVDLADRRPKTSGTKKLTLRCARPETRVQVVGHFIEEVGRDLLSFVVDEPDLDRPGALREAFDLGGLIAVQKKNVISANAHSKNGR